MGETYSQILHLFSQESQYHTHSISVTGYQCFTMKRKSYEVKKTNYSPGKEKQEGQFPTWQRWNNQLLVHFPQKRGKKRGIPFWQDQEEITGFLPPDMNMKKLSSPQSLKTLMAMLPCFYSAADSKFSPSLQLSRAEFVSLLLEAFSAYPCSWSLKSRNYANFKSASHCFFFFQETSSKYTLSFRKIF